MNRIPRLSLSLLICVVSFAILSYCQQNSTTPGFSGPAPVPIRQPIGITLAPVGQGFVDLHTHPLSNLGFGGFVLFGGVDDQSLVAANAANCDAPVTGKTITDVLSDEQPIHGGINLDFLPGWWWPY